MENKVSITLNFEVDVSFDSFNDQGKDARYAIKLKHLVSEALVKWQKINNDKNNKNAYSVKLKSWHTNGI